MSGSDPAWWRWTPSWLARRARASPEAIALVHREGATPFGELAARAARLAGALERSGVGPGARVGLLASDPLACAVALHAIHWRAASAVVLNTRLRVPELAAQLEQAGCVVLLHDGSTRYAADEALHRARGGARCALLSAAASEDAIAPLEAGLDADALVLFTSGTTGRARGARLSHRNLLASARGSARTLPLGPGDRWLACMPLFHVGGLSILTRCLLAGATAVVQPGFDEAAVSEALDRQEITLVSLVPVMLRRLLDERAGRPAPASLRALLLGGAAAPAPWIAEARARGFPVAPTYGLTEACSQVATCVPGEPEAGARPLAGVEVRIVDDARRPCPADTPGRIEVRGETVSPGYLDAAPRADDWLETGDFGLLARDGTLRVLDRRDDLIVSGGENVYPAEVEGVLLAHPAVAEAAVVARADARFGQRPVAFVVARGAAPPSSEELRAFVRERLAGYKAPDELCFVAELPRNAAGKVARRELRARLA